MERKLAELEKRQAGAAAVPASGSGRRPSQPVSRRAAARESSEVQSEYSEGELPGHTRQPFPLPHCALIGRAFPSIVPLRKSYVLPSLDIFHAPHCCLQPTPSRVPAPPRASRTKRSPRPAPSLRFTVALAPCRPSPSAVRPPRAAVHTAGSSGAAGAAAARPQSRWPTRSPATMGTAPSRTAAACQARHQARGVAKPASSERFAAYGLHWLFVL